MTRTKSSRALLSVVLAVLMVAAFMPALTYSSFAATAKKATKVTKLTHTGAKVYGKVGNKYVLKYKLSPSKLTSAAKKTVWKSSDSSIVKVYSTKSNRAAVKAKAEGTAKVTVYTKANKKAKTTWTFKVTKKAETKTELTGVTVSATNVKDAVSDKVSVGETLTANVAPADAKDVTYQWYADGAEIKDATSANFTVTTDQIGKAITVKATSKNDVTSAATAKVAAVKVSGIQLLYGVKNDTTGKLEYTGHDATQSTFPATVGTTLKATSKTGDDDLADAATFKWYRVGKAANDAETTTEIAGATSDTYTLTKDDLGCTIKVVVTPKTGVTATGLSNGTYEKATTVKGSRNISVAINADSKDVSGKTVKLGTALTAAVAPADAAVTYQWQQKSTTGDSWTNVATGASYTPAKAGTYRVVATLGSGETVYTGTPSAQVTVSDATLDSVTIADTKATAADPTAKVGNTLTVQAAMAGNKNLATDRNVKYQWYRVANGTETKVDSKKDDPATYILSLDDVNATVYVKATYGGVTVKSNEITGIKNALKGSNLALTAESKSAEVTVKNASADITWYEYAGTDAAKKIVLKKAATGTKFTPTIANANKVYYAVAEGTGNYAGKVMLAKTVSVDKDGNVTPSTETINTNLTNYVFE